MNLSDLQKDVDLFAHNTMRIRARAQYFSMAKTREELIEVVKLAHHEILPLHVLGGGSNIVITTKTIPGIVVRNLYMKREKLDETEEFVDLKVSSGYPVTKLINETTEEGLEGLEYHLGLPGTVGGAIYMNSKWTHPECYFGDPLVSAHLVTKEGEEKTVERDYFQFAYDFSTLQKTGEILLEAVFRLKKNDPQILMKRAKEAHEYRKKTQPTGVASSGCFFQNITDDQKAHAGVHTKSAGNLIDKSGLKGHTVGNFIVSSEHANFVINRGEGDPEDVKKLMQTMRQKVHEKYGIELKNEVVVI